jgi:outer membrane lipoprotein-sorting protein
VIAPCPPRRAALLVALLAATACAPKRVVLPTDAGEPAPDAQTIAAKSLERCHGLRTLTAEIRLGGRAGRQKVRGRLIAGFQAPDAVRLEAVAPFGPPVFVLAAHGNQSTLLMPRDARVLTGAPPAQMLEALAGAALAPRDLLAFLAGCPAIDPVVTDVRRHGTAWLSFAIDGGTVYLRQRAGSWVVSSIDRSSVRVDYEHATGSHPEAIRLQDGKNSDPRFDLTVTLSQVEINVDLPAEAFTVKVPPDARPMTLEELRQAGPMRDSSAVRRGTS